MGRIITSEVNRCIAICSLVNGGQLQRFLRIGSNSPRPKHRAPNSTKAIDGNSLLHREASQAAAWQELLVENDVFHGGDDCLNRKAVLFHEHIPGC